MSDSIKPFMSRRTYDGILISQPDVGPDLEARFDVEPADGRAKPTTTSDNKERAARSQRDADVRARAARILESQDVTPTEAIARAERSYAMEHGEAVEPATAAEAADAMKAAIVADPDVLTRSTDTDFDFDPVAAGVTLAKYDDGGVVARQEAQAIVVQQEEYRKWLVSKLHYTEEQAATASLPEAIRQPAPKTSEQRAKDAGSAFSRAEMGLQDDA